MPSLDGACYVIFWSDSDVARGSVVILTFINDTWDTTSSRDSSERKSANEVSGPLCVYVCMYLR